MDKVNLLPRDKVNLLQQFDEWCAEIRQQVVDNTCAVSFDWHIDRDTHVDFNINHITHTVVAHWTEFEDTSG